jgi:hypothetical protein
MNRKLIAAKRLSGVSGYLGLASLDAKQVALITVNYGLAPTATLVV